MSPVMPAICGSPEKKSGGARSAITTWPPSPAKAAAMARPMPCEPPLTMATLPAKRPSPNAASLADRGPGEPPRICCCAVGHYQIDQVYCRLSTKLAQAPGWGGLRLPGEESRGLDGAAALV